VRAQRAVRAAGSADRGLVGTRGAARALDHAFCSLGLARQAAREDDLSRCGVVLALRAESAVHTPGRCAERAHRASVIAGAAR
jgi:hypothetical protein